MSSQYTKVLILTAVCVWSGCRTLGGGGGGPQPALRSGTIELWRDADNKCHTNTTPFFRVRKGVDRNVVWKITDKVRCTTTLDVEVKFDKGDADLLPTCEKKNKRKIECSVSTAGVGRSAYSVWLGTEQEDPVLEIEQF